MATTQTEARGRVKIEPRNTRRNEITAIALFALGALLLLSLLTYDWSDPSPHTAHTDAAGAPTHNWAGVVGAYIAAQSFQFIGLAAYLLLFLLFVMAWRRFRARRIESPLLLLVGVVTLLCSCAALLQLFNVPVPSRAFHAGGLVGVLIAGTLRDGLNTVGASILLLALAATSLLLVFNFSFARAYERFVDAFGHPSAYLSSVRARFDAWRTTRREQAEARAAERQAARAEREQAREEQRKLTEKTGADRVADFMRETDANAQVSAQTAIKRAAVVEDELSEEDARILAKEAELARAEAELASILVQPPVDSPARRHTEAANTAAPAASSSVKRTAAPVLTPPVADELADIDEEEAEIEEMVRSASIVRVETEETGADNKPVALTAAERAAARRAERAAALDDYNLPSTELLQSAAQRHEQAEEELRQLGRQIAEKCKEFNVAGKIEHICPGPVVTTYEFKPDPGVKYARVTGLVDDLCLALKAESIRIDRVPGKAHVGIEVPNPQRETISLREVVESRVYRESESKLTIALGKTIDGLNYVADLTRMPHLLIAGATGTGKSVCLNSLVVSILYKARPDEVKFIMIDPKRLELGLYADIPHLATPIITEPKRAANALKWAVAEMERRYKELAGWSVRNIDGFNAEVARRNMVEDFDEEGRPWKPLPYIVIIIDELADLMMVSGHEVEEAITRLAQMARAVGIHLVLATQRPSVDVITGLIKANFPSRIAFRVSSKVDSRTIIDSNGAEQLLGRGDMLFLPPGTSRLIRVHGAFLDETEVSRIVAHIKQQSQPVYDETITLSEDESTGGDGAGGERDELFEQALRICVEMKRASTSVLQRRLRIGYGRAAAILDAMESEGFIGQADGARPRPVLGRAFETVSHWDDLQANDADAT
ncbi:MAG TPA: DNA translocase FtsK 4TM domain-containing protein [Pyrinomonadaceae bacterium]|jgi:S-DNA-T family DNA segregation ATPase FtsK/SpoIIIE